MPRQIFKNVRYWVFDLDNTLYPPEARLFDQIERLMDAFVTREIGVTALEANRLRQRYWKQYGTTLSGLMHEHDIDPEQFLAEVHDIELSALSVDLPLANALCSLPGRKIIYTNGSRQHAERVSKARGIRHAFDAIYGIEDACFVPKPRKQAFQSIFAADGMSPNGSAIFEDEARNLAAPYDLGMHTVLVGPSVKADHIHHQTCDLAGFLSRLV